MMLICQQELTIDVAPCFVLRANRSLVGVLHNNGLRHSTPSYETVSILFLLLNCLFKIVKNSRFEAEISWENVYYF
jgi:type IV secretory pathway VirB4 component